MKLQLIYPSTPFPYQMKATSHTIYSWLHREGIGPKQILNSKRSFFNLEVCKQSKKIAGTSEDSDLKQEILPVLRLSIS